jgi:transcription antitermination factor NusG
MSTADDRPNFAPGSFVAPEGAHWLAFRTKARAEKVVANYCIHRGFGIAYLPLRRSVRRYAKGPRTHWLPLLPGYVFAACDPEQAQTFQIESSGICGVINTSKVGEKSLINDLIQLRELELAQIHGHLEMRPEIVVGKSVKINHGPLRGVSGIVERRAGKARISVNVELIGQAATLEVDVDEVTLELE